MPHVDHELFYEFVGARIKTARLRRKWNIAELAIRSGIDTYIVADIESGMRRNRKSPGSLVNYFTIARALNVPFGELLPPYGIRDIHVPNPNMARNKHHEEMTYADYEERVRIAPEFDPNPEDIFDDD